MAKKKYRAAPRAPFNDKMAAIIGGILEQFGDSLTPEQLVEIARPTRSPIHKLFCWDNTKAANMYRVEQARHIIRHVEIEIVYDKKPMRTRAYHAVVIDSESPAERHYTSIAAIQKSPELSGQVIRQAGRELKGWRTRYKDYSSIFGGVFREADKVLAGS